MNKADRFIEEELSPLIKDNDYWVERYKEDIRDGAIDLEIISCFVKEWIKHELYSEIFQFNLDTQGDFDKMIVSMKEHILEESKMKFRYSTLSPFLSATKGMLLEEAHKLYDLMVDFS